VQTSCDTVLFSLILTFCLWCLPTAIIDLVTAKTIGSRHSASGSPARTEERIPSSSYYSATAVVVSVDTARPIRVLNVYSIK